MKELCRVKEQFNRVYLALGSNLGEREMLLNRCISLLNERVGSVVSRSKFYETEPWGFVSVHPFLNAAVALDTLLSPFDLLEATQQIERLLGRVSKNDGTGYRDRTVDIDILFYNESCLVSDRLMIPHPLLHKRLFVLNPLVEIASEFCHPVLHRTIREMQQDCLAQENK